MRSIFQRNFNAVALTVMLVACAVIGLPAQSVDLNTLLTNFLVSFRNGSITLTGHSAMGNSAEVDHSPDVTTLTLYDAQTQVLSHAIGVSNTLVWTPASNANARNIAGYDSLIIAGPLTGVTIPSLIGYSVNLAAGYNGSTTGTITQSVGIAVNTGTKTSATLTTNYGIKIDNQTIGSTNYALYTGTGRTSLGDALQLRPQASPPSGASSGDMYMDSSPAPDELCVYDGAGWQALITGTDSNCA